MAALTSHTPMLGLLAFTSVHIFQYIQCYHVNSKRKQQDNASDWQVQAAVNLQLYIQHTVNYLMDTM